MRHLRCFYKRFILILMIFIFASSQGCSSKKDSGAEKCTPSVASTDTAQSCEVAINTGDENNNENKSSQDKGVLAPTQIENSGRKKITQSSGFGIPDKNETIISLGRAPIDILGAHLRLSTTKFSDYSYRLQNTGGEPHNLETVLQDFSDCGFSYQGPNCYEGQEIVVMSQEFLQIGNKKYVYTVFSYSSSYNGIFALFLAVPEKNAAGEHKAYLYTILKPESHFSPENVANEKNALSIASLDYDYITADNVSDLYKNATNLRQSLSLFKTGLSFPQLSQSVARLGQLKSDLKITLAKTETELGELNDPNLACLFLEMQKLLYEGEKYITYLKQNLHSSLSNIASESALMLVALRIFDDEDIDKKYAKALTAEHLGQQYRAFSLARKNIGVTPRVLQGLINTLAHPNILSAETAFKILNDRVLNDDYVEKLAKISSKVGQNGHVYEYAIDLLKKIDSDAARNAIIAQLSNKVRIIREKIVKTCGELVFTPGSINAATEHMESDWDPTKEAASRILDGIDTPEATLVLIKYMDQDGSDPTRGLIISFLGKENKVFTELHLEELTTKLSSKYFELVLEPVIKFIFKINTPNSILVLLKFFNKKFNKLLSENFVLQELMADKFAKVSFTEVHAEEIGKATVGDYKKYRRDFLFRLMGIRHALATDVMLSLLKSNQGQMQVFLPEVKKEILARLASDKELFSGESGFLAGDLYMIGEYNIDIINKRLKPMVGDTESKEYFQEINTFSFDLLMSLDSLSALKAKIILMGMSDDDKRHQIIAAISQNKKDIPVDYYWYLLQHLDNIRDQSSSSSCYGSTSCGPSLSASQAMFLSKPSQHKETRDLAIKLLKEIYLNPEAKPIDSSKMSVRESILDGLLYNFTPGSMFTSVYSEELEETIAEECLNAFIEMLQSDQTGLPERTYKNLIGRIANLDNRCSDPKKPEEIVDHGRVLRLWPYFPRPGFILDHMYEYFIACQHPYPEYPEFEDELVATLSKMQPPVFQQEMEQVTDRKEKEKMLSAYLWWVAPPNTEMSERCQFLEKNAYLDPLRITILQGVSNVEMQLGVDLSAPWYVQLTVDCPHLAETNPGLVHFFNPQINAASEESVPENL